MARHPGGSPIDTAYLCPDAYWHNRSKQEWEPCSQDELFAWSQQMIQDARSYLRLQPAYKYISDGMDIINGDFLVTDVQSLSNVKTETVRNTREIVAAQTNLKIVPSFKSQSEIYREQNQILNKGFLAWQNMTFADRSVRKAWQWACVGGTGYIGSRYDPNYYNIGSGDMVWDAYGPLDVLPLGLKSDLKINGAYAVALRKQMPIHQVWRMFPLQRDNIKANRVNSLGKGMVVAQAVKFASAVLRRFSQGALKPETATTWDNVDVYYIYIDDQESVNETGRPIQMMGPDGRWGTKWSYTVPFVGQKIETGHMLRDGSPDVREAKHEDCLLYPNRRLVIATDHCIINPAPEHQASYRWDGKVPAVQFRCDDWAWNFLGFPATRYGQSLEKLIIELWRGIGDKMNLSLNPSAFYDRNSQAQSILQTMNPRIPGLRTGVDMTLNPAASQWTPCMPYQWYQVDSSIIETAAKILPALLKEQMGVADVTAMARARQLPSGDSTEKLLEAMGPLIKDQSRNMEESIRDLGEQWKSDCFQFWTAKRRMQLLGPEGVAEEDLDFDPGTLIPLEKDPKGGKAPLEMRAGPDGSWSYSPDSPERRMPSLGIQQFERARWHKGNFAFSVTPYSLHEFNSSTRKLFMLQAMKLGFPLSWWTQAEQIFDIKDFGPCMFKDPETGVMREARNEIERYTVQLEIMARIAQASGGGQGKGGKGQGRGRPQSFQQPPTMESKANGSASTVRTSQH